MNERLRKLLPHTLDLALTRLLRSWRAARERRYYSAVGLRYSLPSGLRACINDRAEWMAFTDIFVGRIYDDAITAALAAADVSRTFHVVDLGANVGYFALRFLDLAMQRYGRELPIHIILVEPSRSLCAELQTRLVHQIRPNATVTLTNGLAGVRSGSAELYESAFHIGNSLTPDRYAHKSVVPYVDLEELTASVKTIHLLKCDIEGAEETFLENYPQLLDKVEVGAMELHHALCDTRHCRQLLVQRGFHLNVTRATEWFDELWFQRR